MAFFWEDTPGYVVSAKNPKETLDLKVPFQTDGLGEAHAPALLARLQQLGIAEDVKALEVEEWASVLLVNDAFTGSLVALISLEV